MNQPVPSVSAIKLNGKIICNANETHTNTNRPNSKPSNSRPSNTRPQQQNSGSNTHSQNRPLNVDADSYNKDQNDFNPAFGNGRPNTKPASNTQSNTRPQNSVSNTRPSSQSGNNNNARPSYNEYDTSGTSRPVQSSNSNTRPSYNEYDTVSGTSNRPLQSSNTNARPSYQNEYDAASSSRPVSGSNVNRPLNVDVDSYGTNQNEFSPAFGSVGDNTYNQGLNNNNNNR